MSKRLCYRSPLAPRSSRHVYADWLRKLRGKNGAYVIRSSRTREVLYVGESHKGRLYQTITRHLQTWKGPTSGETYSAGSVEIAVRRTTARVAYSEQVRLIRRLNPRDNTAHDPDFDDVPF